jgi:hypothetical protein
MLHTMNIRIKDAVAEETLELLKEKGNIEVIEEHHIPVEVQAESLRRLHLMKSQPGYALEEEDFFRMLNESEDEAV